CADVTVTIPKETVGPNQQGFSGLITFAAAMGGLYGGIAICGLFTARGIFDIPLLPGESWFQRFARDRETAWAWNQACGYFLANLIELPVNNLWLGQNITGPIAGAALSFAVAQFANSRAFPFLAAWTATQAGRAFSGVWPMARNLEQRIGLAVLDP